MTRHTIESEVPATRWPFYAVAAVALGLYLGVNHALGVRSAVVPIAVWKPFVWEISSVLVVFSLIPLILRLERRFPVDARPRLRVIAVHSAAALVFSAVHTSCMVLIRMLAYRFADERYDFGNPWLGGFYELQKDVITYAVILTVIFALREFTIRRAGELRAAELAAELGEARLRHLTAQIEPHFLFNALNAISNRMYEDVDAADRMIAHLGNLLRAAYEDDHRMRVPLDRELRWLGDYAAMMSERFRGQLTFDCTVEPGLGTVMVPRLLLQPIVENALKHGLGAGRGRLAVDVRRMGGDLRYTISDDGVGPPAAPFAFGTGLSNVARRLELLFGADHALVIEPRQPHGTTVTIRFPVPP